LGQSVNLAVNNLDEILMSAFSIEDQRDYEITHETTHNFIRDLIKIRLQENGNETKIVKLRELPVISTRRGWAHIREDGSIRRYYISHVFDVPVREGEVPEDVDTVLKKEIAKVEGYKVEDIEFHYLPQPEHKYIKKLPEVKDKYGLTKGPALQVEPLPADFTPLMPKEVEKALNQNNFKQLIAEYDEEIRPMPWWVGVGARWAEKLHKFIYRSDIYIQVALHSKWNFYPHTWLRKLFMNFYVLRDSYFQRKLHVCKYIAVRSKESDLGIAVSKVFLDLDKLTRLNLIKGQLVSPFLFALANIEGDDQPKYIVASYFHVPMEYESIVDNLSKHAINEGEMGSMVESKPTWQNKKILFHPDVEIFKAEQVKKAVKDIKNS